MKTGIKTIQILLLSFAIALFAGATTSYAFTVKDGENVIESPDKKTWIKRIGFYPDGRLLVVDVFNGDMAETGLSVELSASDLKNSANLAPYMGEVHFYVFVNNTSIFAELTKEDDAIILKDITCVLTNTGSEISSDDIKGGTYNPSEEAVDELIDEEDSENNEAGAFSSFISRYQRIYEEMLVTYKSSEDDQPPEENIETPPAEEPETPPTDPEEGGNEEPAVTPTEPPAETPAQVPTTPAETPKETPAETPSEAPEETPSEQTVRQEAKVPTQETKETVEQKKEVTAKVTEPSEVIVPKRIETTIMGEVLSHQITATVPAGLDERTVSNLQKQVSETVDGLLKELEENPSAAKERVSEETLRNIERALSEGKEISAEVMMETTTAESVPASDKDAFVLITSDNEETNLKIGKYFNISVIIKAADGEELGTYNETTEKVLFTLPKPKDVPCPSGMEYVVIRVHEGEATILPVTVNADGSISFETDRFSSYALAVREVLDEEVAKADAAASGKNGSKDEDLMDFAKWFLRILVFAFASGTIVILFGLRDKKKTK